MSKHSLGGLLLKKIQSGSLLILSLVLAACAGPANRAPVVDRLPSRSLETQVSPDGYYTVKPGDTLYSIAMQFGLDWHELARANGLSDPGKLAIGQKLLVEGLPSAVDAPVAGGGGVEVRPVPDSGTASGQVAKPIPMPTAPDAPAEKPPQNAASYGFIWPHNGALLKGFKAGVNKGIDLKANVGDPVKAAKEGKVVYAGNALRGYGNLIIVKHDNDLLTAYAHNQTLLVKEGDQVKSGQRIAEAGKSDAPQPMLHFEVRKSGKPVDPMIYLPSR